MVALSVFTIQELLHQAWLPPGFEPSCVAHHPFFSLSPSRCCPSCRRRPGAFPLSSAALSFAHIPTFLGHTWQARPYIFFRGFVGYQSLPWLNFKSASEILLFSWRNTPSPPRKYPSELFCFGCFESDSCSTRKGPNSVRITFSFYQYPQDPGVACLPCTYSVLLSYSILRRCHDTASGHATVGVPAAWADLPTLA